MMATKETAKTHCDMGVGCEEYGVCYAAAHGAPWKCPLSPDYDPTPDSDGRDFTPPYEP